MKKGVIFITIDSARQDYLYGPLVSTPNIDKLRVNSVTMREVFSQTNTTISSLISIFTSQYVTDHGNYSDELKRPLPSWILPEYLKGRGWQTAAVCGINIVRDILGNQFKYEGAKQRGIIIYRTFIGAILKIFSLIRKVRFFKKTYKMLAKLRRDLAFTMAEELIHQTIKILNKFDQSKPIFLWVHFFDSHLFYYAPKDCISMYYEKNINDTTKDSIENQLKTSGVESFSLEDLMIEEIHDIDYYPALYRASLTYIDREIGRLLDYLKDAGLYDDYMIILTADHGENMLENGIYCGHKKLFDETTKVPLIIKFPGNLYAGQEHFGLTELVDIYPTILSQYGYNDYESRLRGRDIRSDLAAGKNQGREYAVCEHAWNYQRSIRTVEWQYIENLPQGSWKKENSMFGKKLATEGDFLLSREKNERENMIKGRTEVVIELQNTLKDLLNAK